MGSKSVVGQAVNPFNNNTRTGLDISTGPIGLLAEGVKSLYDMVSKGNKGPDQQSVSAEDAAKAAEAQSEADLEARRRSFLSLINTSPQGVLNPQKQQGMKLYAT